MTGILGWVLLIGGLGLILLGLARPNEDHRPFMRGQFMFLVYPSFCLVLVTAGIVMVTAQVLR